MQKHLAFAEQWIKLQIYSLLTTNWLQKQILTRIRVSAATARLIFLTRCSETLRDRAPLSHKIHTLSKSTYHSSMLVKLSISVITSEISNFSLCQKEGKMVKSTFKQLFRKDSSFPPVLHPLLECSYLMRHLETASLYWNTITRPACGDSTLYTLS